MASIDNMILSASGWRSVFAATGREDDNADQISPAHRIISGAAALVFAEYLRNLSDRSALVLIGSDTRPTGNAIARAMIPVLLACGCRVHYAGFIAAPEIMAWARSPETAAATGGIGAAGFIYISASHNPIGYNGIKFGLTDGGVLPAQETEKLICAFRSFMEREDCAGKIESLISAADPALLEKVYSGAADAKARGRTAYHNFCSRVIWGGNADIAAALKEGLVKRQLGIVCDFNGSARTVSIDSDFFNELGIKFASINDKPGEIVHRIVPEGESLEPCRVFLEEAHGRDASFTLGYVPDCDGDRGNLVIWDGTAGMARCLEAQEVFALVCIAELAHLVWTGELSHDSNGAAFSKAAIAVNDPTSLRVDRIAAAFGVSVFRAEVGEANVVALARKLRDDGYIVRVLGEGSAGGNITHPAAVRDPINTVMALAKLLLVRGGGGGKKGLFEIWCDLSGQAGIYSEDFCLADIIASLPPFVTTGAYAEEAVLRINTKDHGILKEKYQKIFLREWEERKEYLNERYRIKSWEAIAYNGLEEKRGLSRFSDAGSGGLKICFLSGEGAAIAAIWMRGSATEPVFRIMADAEGSDNRLERDLIEWQRRMTIEADGG
ncbi:MAG: phosphatidylglycerol lysyltransferase [Treponema sp.]|nr:phosphatidylglycerol lysyltransferase [Treponema sp.]